jgi:two-component sensor histidine kinase
MQVEYQTEKKDNDIKLLRQQEELQRSRLTQVRTSRNLVIAGIVVLALLLGLVYSRYRIKKRSIEEKEVLIKEIHHRVKNNLQIVISLLNVQSEFLDNPSALAAIQESRERMHAIAIIHQKLYQVDNSTLINIQSYIYELIDNLKKSFDNSGRIYFQLDIADICLDVSQSVPLSLILNEAITNAIKYAFFPHEQGTIIVALDMIDHRQVQLKIKDNGKGLPPGMDIKNNHSLGFQLMHLFTEQLEGTLDLLNEGGLTITLSFPSM